MNDLQDKYKIQIIGRGAYFERICEYVEEKLETTYDVKCLVLPTTLPSFIDQPEDLISLKEFDNPDLLISASIILTLHFTWPNLLLKQE